MTDPLLTQLRDLATAGESAPPPPGLIEAARSDAPRLHARRRAWTQTRAGVVGVAAALLVAASFTPPGRAATGWVAEVAGIGDEPTLEHRDAEAGTAVVFGSGTTPDGTAYEILAYRTSPREFLAERDRLRRSPKASGAEKWVCPAIDFPEYRFTGGEFCWVIGSGPGPVGLSAMSFGLPTPEVQRPPEPLWGEIGPEVKSVRVRFTAAGKESRDLETTVAHLSGPLQERVGADHPFGMFVAFPPLPSAVTEWSDLAGYRLTAVAYGRDGKELDRRQVLPGPLSTYESRSGGLEERLMRAHSDARSN
jgi:hypothetical protein